MKKLIPFFIALLATHVVYGQKISELTTRSSGSLSANGSIWLPLYDSGSPAETYRVSVETLGTVLGAGVVSDGDKGDLTVSSTGTVWTVDNDIITYAKLQNVSATSRILGRITAGAGDVEELTQANVLTLINVEAGADVTDAANVDAAGAVMNSDTSTASMSFVIDDDSFATASATTLSTSESVKAYVDANSGGGASDSFTTAADGDATPSVTGVTVLQVNNTSATTITAFDDGTTAQRIVVQVLDANTSIENNSSIKLHGSATRPSQTGGYVVNMRYSGTQWVEESIGSSFGATVSVLNDGSDNIAITNPVTDVAVSLESTGSASTVDLAVAGTTRLSASNTGVNVTGALTVGGTAIVLNDGTLGGGSPSTTGAPSESAVQTYVAANSGSATLKRLTYSGMLIGPGTFGSVQNGTNMSSAAPTADQLRMWPVRIDANTSVTALRSYVTAGAAGFCRLVLYSSDANGWPDAVLEESGAIDVENPTGNRDYAFASPRTLTPDIYWIGMSTDAATFRVHANGSLPCISVALSGTPYTSITLASQDPSSAFPATWTFVSTDMAQLPSSVWLVTE